MKRKYLIMCSQEAFLLALIELPTAKNHKGCRPRFFNTPHFFSALYFSQTFFHVKYWVKSFYIFQFYWHEINAIEWNWTLENRNSTVQLKVEFQKTFVSFTWNLSSNVCWKLYLEHYEIFVSVKQLLLNYEQKNCSETLDFWVGSADTSLFPKIISEGVDFE